MHRAALLGNQLAPSGCHGQNLRHRRLEEFTLQANNPALLAELTGMAVAATFASSGQGAPQVPRTGRPRRPVPPCGLANLGGIANGTNLVLDKSTSGFDCSPANMLLDAWAEKYL